MVIPEIDLVYASNMILSLVDAFNSEEFDEILKKFDVAKLILIQCHAISCRPTE
jgi:hypothetical protein